MKFRSVLLVPVAVSGALYASGPAAAQATLGPVLKAANAIVVTGRAPLSREWRRTGSADGTVTRGVADQCNCLVEEVFR